MNLIELGKQLAAAGLPLLGAALPVPGGAALGAALASALGLKDAQPETLAAAVADPEALQKAREFEATHQERMLDIVTKAELAQRAADSADIGVVNKTMEVELANSANENWWQKGWRPFNGYVVGLGSFIAVVYVCYLFYVSITRPELGMSLPAVINVVPQLAMAVAAILAVPGAAVGITAWHRGVRQRLEVEKTPPGG